jgi:hypothetical protein
MKTITFNYTKKDGSSSERTLVAFIEPHEATDKYAGIDISSLDPETGSEFAARLHNLHQKYLDEIEDLKAEFDLKHNYRQFLVSGMTDVIEI